MDNKREYDGGEWFEGLLENGSYAWNLRAVNETPTLECCMILTRLNEPGWWRVALYTGYMFSRRAGQRDAKCPTLEAAQLWAEITHSLVHKPTPSTQ